MSLVRTGVFRQSMFTKTNYLAGPKTIGTEMLNSVRLQEKKPVYFLNTVKPNSSALRICLKPLACGLKKNHFKEHTRIYKLPLFKNCINDISLKILD